MEIQARYPNVLFVLVAASGAGKTTLSQRLMTEFGLRRIASCTTRPRREDEPETAYHFLSRDEFERQVAAGGFAAWAALFEGHLYGHRWCDLDVLNEGPAFTDMTEHGVRDLRAMGVRIYCIRLEVLNQTPLERIATASRQQIDKERTQIPIGVDAVIVNDHADPDGLEQAYQALVALIRAQIA